MGSNNSGFYTLQAVLTHQGRSSSSGHYVGWVRLKDDKWVKFDDNIVTPITSEEVLRLSGGGILSYPFCFTVINIFLITGDWHSAYVLLYGPKILELPNEVEKMQE